MKIKVRIAENQDKEAACRVEGRSTPRLRYLERMWDSFVNDPQGPLFVAEIAGKIVGLGKLSQLYDGSGWLETLRVDPAYQRQGVGKAIYRAYLAYAEQQQLPYLRMYTGCKNAVSAGLARFNGFKLVGRYSGADLCVEDKATPQLKTSFRQVQPSRAAHLLSPLASGWQGFMVFNRTFYRFNTALYTGLAQESKVYCDQKGESLLTLGARFMPERGLHIGIIKGDATACLDFALYQAKEAKVAKLSIMFPPARTDIKAALLTYGFTMQASDCIVLEYACK